MGGVSERVGGTGEPPPHAAAHAGDRGPADRPARSSAGAPKRKLHRLPPPFDDLAAGLTVALVLIPQSMAYASLAGLPPSAGLMAAIFPPIVTSAFASSPHLQTGPTALTSLLTLGILSSLAVPGTTQYVAMAALLALMVGGIRIVIGALRFGALAYFMSLPVLRGFTSGAAVLIVASQVPSVLGVDAGRRAVWSAAWYALREPPAWSLGALTLAIVTLVLVRGLRRVSPLVPGTLLAVIVGLLVARYLGHVGPMVGEMPTVLNLPSLNLPWARAADLALGATVIAIVGFAEPAAIARTFAERSRPWNADRELMAQGVANVVSGVVGGFPVGGSFGRSALGRQAGGRTRLSGLVAGLTVLVFFPFADVLATLPKAVLGAVVISAASSLLDLRSLFRLWRFARLQATTALATFVLTLVLAPRVDYAVILGISAALLTHLYREAQLGVRFTRENGTIRVELDGVLWFGSTQALEKVLARIENQLAGVHCVVIDANHLGRIDFSALMLLHDLETRLRLSGLEVRLEGMHGRSETILERIRRG